MAFKSYKEESKKNWGITQIEDLSTEQIQLGAILRIADATEAMAKNHVQLITQRDMYERWYNNEKTSHSTTKRTLIATKGHLTRAQNQIKELKSLLAEKETPIES